MEYADRLHTGGLGSAEENDLHQLGLPYCPDPDTGLASVPEHFIEACSNGIAVPDPEDKPGLVEDCAILLSIRDTLAFDTLNWSADTPIQEWEGVTTTPAGVTYLELFGYILTGTIPPALGNLDQLRGLGLAGPALTGSIPPELGRLARLEWLMLLFHDLSGPIPPELGNLGQLNTLVLTENSLTGSIPPELADLPNLRVLSLHGNRLTGCVPVALRSVERQDLHQLGLPDCPEPGPGKTGTGLAPGPPGALPVAVNVFAVVATLAAVLGIVAGLRTRYRC